VSQEDRGSRFSDKVLSVYFFASTLNLAGRFLSLSRYERNITSCGLDERLPCRAQCSENWVSRSSAKPRILRAFSGNLENSERNSNRSGGSPVIESNRVDAAVGKV
jgi:hypothetical protein